MMTIPYLMGLAILERVKGIARNNKILLEMMAGLVDKQLQPTSGTGDSRGPNNCN